MKLDYIEIGTSDFDTLVQSTDMCGISIDPLKIYLDRLPDKPTNIKINAAISNFDGTCDVYYIDTDDIKKNNLPDWLRGCNSILNPHPSVLNVLQNANLLDLYKTKKIDVISWDTLIRKNNISSVDYLKIDTEGHDCTIIKSILDSDTNILPKKIKFETNILTSKEEISNTISSLEERGYKIIEQTPENTTVELMDYVINKIIFASDSNPDYIDFWEINSKVCSKKLKITPVLFYICDEESDFYWDKYGLIKKVKRVSDNTSFEAQIFRMFGTKYFMDDVCLTSDIDMLLFNPSYLKNKVIDKNSITIFGSDGYDPARPECKGVYSGPDRYPICYNVATGNIFNIILNTNVEYYEYYNRLFNLNLGVDTDEIYFGQLVNKTYIKINKIKRGYSSNFHLSDRIEKYNFHESSPFRLNLYGDINISKYIDCHCERPYNKYKVQIDNIVDLVLFPNVKR